MKIIAAMLSTSGQSLMVADDGTWYLMTELGWVTLYLPPVDTPEKPLTVVAGVPFVRDGAAQVRPRHYTEVR